MRLTRRELIKGMGVAAGGLGLAGTAYERLIPYIHQPEDIVPGVSTWYATSCRECPAGCGMLLRNRDSRVVKCEGNPVHPVNQGRLCARGQAALQGLYDPDRLRGPMRRSNGVLQDVSWDEALKSVGNILNKHPRIVILSSLENGSIAALMKSWVGAVGTGGVVFYEPINYEAVKSASKAATGKAVIPSFMIESCDYLVSFAADFLETWISPVEYAREFAKMREIQDGKRGRFVDIGPRMTMTATNADEVILVPPGAEADVALAIASELGAPGVPAGFSADDVGARLKIDAGQIRGIAAGLKGSKAPLALPGGNSRTARAAMFLNGAVGSSQIDFDRPHVLTGSATTAEMSTVIDDMRDGKVDVLVIRGCNPVYSLPQADQFGRAMKKVGTVLSLSSFMDETSAEVDWILPSNTALESWGDYSPYPGITNLMQPTMGTLFNTRQDGDILMDLAKASGINPESEFGAANFYEYLSKRSAGTWQDDLQVGGRWQGAPKPVIESISSSGDQPAVVTGIAASPGGAILSPDGSDTTPTTSVKPAGKKVGSFVLGQVNPFAAKQFNLFPYVHIYLYDGRGANKRWLQELAEPVLKTVWGSWAELHPETAKKLGVGWQDVIEISSGHAKISVPVRVWRGVARDTIMIPTGQGHTQYGRYASDIGANVFALLASESPEISVRKTGNSERIVFRRGDPNQHGRNIARTVELDVTPKREKIIYPMPSGYTFNDFYAGHDHVGHRWAMVVDMNKCIGCHACVAACYAENNIAVVGATDVWRRRDMEWLRIDPYIDWSRKNSPIIFQPMLCQHCDAAPCEPVCPVFASSHNQEGVNMQIYNRCVGTRYCSNNCPYKVRRFNWYDYDWPEPLNMQLNPDVTVRCRGVMEKCTFCWQRIKEAEIVAEREGRTLKDGEVIPACVETCPTGVFTFGDLKDKNSRVSQLVRDDPRVYQVLQEPLNTKPAVFYLKRVVEEI